MDNQRIGNFIKRKRKEKGLTQQALGDLVGVSFKAVSKWECGISIPDISILKKLCEVLDISIDELLDGKNKVIFKRKKKTIITATIITLIVILAIIILNLQLKLQFDENDLKQEKYNCTLVKTYRIENINKSNDENYLYITFKEYQNEGVYAIKLSKTISKNLEQGKNYEFTFNINKKYVFETPDMIFKNSELINITNSDKIGMEQKNEFNCQ